MRSLDPIRRRIDALEPTLPCPRCAAEAARGPLTEAEIDKRLKYLIEVIEGRRELDPERKTDLPDPSPTCPKCRKHMAEIAALSEEQVDVRLAELLPLLKESIGYEPEYP